MAAKKMPADAKRHICEWIVAGHTNNEIRQKLDDAGFDSNLADASIGHYRSSDDVQEAIARKDQQAIQCGLAQRSERILRLARHAKRFERRLADSPEALDFASGKPMMLAALSKEYRETLKDLGVLVDPKATAPPLNASLEIVVNAASTADAKFSRFVARLRTGEDGGVLANTDRAGESGT